MTDQNPLRKLFVWLIEWSWFENFITLSIILNSVLLASTDYKKRLNPNYESEWEPTQQKIDDVFTWIFIFECVSKVIGMGFLFSKKAYLKDAWNCLDFFIVVVSIVGMLPSVDSQSLKALRTFRVLRPLRSINALPTMRNLIQSLLASIPGLVNVIFFLGFIFSIFAIFGVNQFQGKHTSFCRATKEPIYSVDADGKNVFTEWKILDEEGRLCKTDQDCVDMYYEGAVCGELYQSDLFEPRLDPLLEDEIRNKDFIMYGIPNFDSFGNAIVTIFQVLTLESWSYLLYRYTESVGGMISVIFFILIVIMGSFFTMNLILAMIMEQFNQ